MEEFLNKVGQPRVLTQAEYREFGYRGALAGYTPLEDLEFHLAFCRDELNKARTNMKDY
jgi:hypothetical protein